MSDQRDKERKLSELCRCAGALESVGVWEDSCWSASQGL